MRKTVAARLAGSCLIAGWATLMLVACAASDAKKPLETTTAAAGSINTAESDRPAMWHMADDDSEVYLFGTFHILPTGVEWTSPAYRAAMKATDTTIVEADIESPESMDALAAELKRNALNPEGVTLSERLGSQRAAKLAGVVENLGISMATLEPLQPWLVLVTLTQAALQQAGYNSAQGVEAVILGQAKSEGDNLSYLETADGQIKLLAGLYSEELFGQFDLTLDQFAQIKELTDSLLEAWRSGNLKAMEKLIQEPLRNESPEAYAKLFTDRNANWTEQIDALMMGDGQYFIAVGAGHLVGDGSVISMLREKGYQVERVQ